MKLLVRTLFSPYRQISAGAVRGNITVQFRAFIDRTVSRFVGFFVRSFVLLAGAVCLLGLIVGGVLWLLFWIALPVLPIGMIVLTVMGVTP